MRNKEEEKEEGEERGREGGGSSEATQIFFCRSQVHYTYTGSSYDIVILTRKQQAWVSQRDIKIRFAISHTFLTPIYSLVTLVRQRVAMSCLHGFPDGCESP